MNAVTKHRVRRYAGAAVRDSIESTADVAKRVDRTQRTIQRWGDGENPSPLTAFLEWLENVDDLFRIVSHVSAFAKWKVLNSKPTAELVERYHDLKDVEHDREAAQNRALQNGADPDEEIGASERHAAILTELSAVRLILDARHIDPRDYRRATP